MMTAPIPIEARIQANQYLNDLYEYAFLHENGKVFLGFSERTVRAILEKRLAAGRLISHRDRHGRIDGMFAWHKFRAPWTWEQVAKWREDDEDGDELFLAYLFADSAKVMAELAIMFIAREPDALHLDLTGIRRRSGKPVKIPLSQKFLARIIKKGKRNHG